MNKEQVALTICENLVIAGIMRNEEANNFFELLMEFDFDDHREFVKMVNLLMMSHVVKEDILEKKHQILDRVASKIANAVRFVPQDKPEQDITALLPMDLILTGYRLLAVNGCLELQRPRYQRTVVFLGKTPEDIEQVVHSIRTLGL